MAFTLSARSSDWSEVFAIGLWQSLQASPRDSCIEPIQCNSGPPSWHCWHIAFICAGSWIESREKAAIVADVGFVTCARPGPWQASHCLLSSALRGLALKARAWMVSSQCEASTL